MTKLVTGNLALDMMIAACKLQYPGSEYVKLLQVDISTETESDVELTPEWWNSYEGYLKLVFKDKEGEKTVLTKRFTPWKDTD